MPGDLRSTDTLTCSSIVIIAAYVTRISRLYLKIYRYTSSAPFAVIAAHVERKIRLCSTEISPFLLSSVPHGSIHVRDSICNYCCTQGKNLNRLCVVKIGHTLSNIIN